MRKLLAIFAIIALASAQVEDNSDAVAIIYDTCDWSQNSYVLYAGQIDNLDDFPYEITSIIFQKKGKLTFYEDDDAEGRQFVVTHDLDCILPEQVSWSDPQAQFFIKRNEKLRAKNAKKSSKQQTMNA